MLTFLFDIWQLKFRIIRMHDESPASELKPIFGIIIH